MLAALSDRLKERLAHLWQMSRRPAQWPPEGDWTTWLILGGRGSGKTRAGAEWLRAAATGNRMLFGEKVGRLAIVGETYGDAREVMVEGPSGLLRVHRRDERPVWISSRRRLEWSNGAVAQVFSSDDPEALRGPQFGAAWCDELGKWRHPQATWDMLQFGLRLGEFPRQVVTTTPRPLPLLRSIMEDERTVVTRMTTEENRKNLARGFLERIVGNYRGTRLGRQELDGEIIGDRVDALWQRDLIERCRAPVATPMRRIVIAVDPPVTSKVRSDKCGIVACGLGDDDRAYVLRDATLAAVSPERWSRAVVSLFESLEADRVIVETNQGGDMAESVLRAASPNLPVRQVKASRGKYLRAEPVAHLYERGLVAHAGCFAELEDEMCDFGLDGLSSGRSPDRLDALVWALTELMLAPGSAPRIRGL